MDKFLIMKYQLLMVLGALLASPAQAEEIERDTITSCAYQAGTAYQIQNIRRIEGDNWSEFEANIKKIYAESQGRDDMLVIAKQVFIHPADKSANFIHDIIFNACVSRQQGTESKF